MIPRHLRQQPPQQTNKPLLITIGFLIAAVLAMGIYLISDGVSKKNEMEQALQADVYSRMGTSELSRKAKEGDQMALQESGRRFREVKEALIYNVNVLNKKQ